MSFILPNDLALKYNVSLKTIYNYLSKYSWKIRAKKEYWKQYVFEPDFGRIYSKDVQSIQNVQRTTKETNPDTEPWTLKEDFEILQKDYKALSDQQEKTSKYNLALQEQVTKYGMLLMEEKNEKKDLIAKYDRLQKEYYETLVTHGKEKVKSAKAFYLLLWILIILLLIISSLLFLPQIEDAKK